MRSQLYRGDGNRGTLWKKGGGACVKGKGSHKEGRVNLKSGGYEGEEFHSEQGFGRSTVGLNKLSRRF